MGTGNVRFLREHLVIVVDTGLREHEIDIRDVTSSAALLETILQVANKGWCTPEILFHFITCVNHACQEVHGAPAHEVFCHGGQDRRVTWNT